MNTSNLLQAKYVPAYFLGTIVLLIGVAGVAKKISGNSENPFNQDVGAVLVSGQTPDGFFSTVPPPPMPEEVPLPPKVVEVEEEPLPSSSELFRFLSRPNLDPTPEESQRAKILNQLYVSSAIGEINTFDRRASHMAFYEKPFRDRVQSKDTDINGVPKRTATYPIDLDRVLTMNKHIPVVLYTKINSEIPSQKVIAVTESNIVGFHGRNILIPRGTQFIGRFEALESPDSQRMALVWYRALTPAGININLNSESIDEVGQSGLTGLVDQKWKEKYGTALLFSSISALIQLSVPTENDSAKAAADAFSDELGPIVAEQLRKSMDIVPKIIIPRGTRLNISPLVDIWFKEPKQGAVATLPINSGAIFN